MEELNVAGKKYISSKRAAKMTGYTHDYLGQLCRGGKLSCKRVGKTWYISEESVTTHKKRYKKEQEQQRSEERSGRTEMSLGMFTYKAESGALQPSINPKKRSTAGVSTPSSSETEKTRTTDTSSRSARLKKVKPSPHVADIREAQQGTQQRKRAAGDAAATKQEKPAQRRTRPQKKQGARKSRNTRGYGRRTPVTAILILLLVVLFSAGVVTLERTVEYQSSRKAANTGFNVQLSNAYEALQSVISF